MKDTEHEPVGFINEEGEWEYDYEECTECKNEEV